PPIRSLVSSTLLAPPCLHSFPTRRSSDLPGAVQRVSETFGHRAADDFLMVDGRSGGGPSVRERDKVALPVRHPQHQVSECEVGEDRKSTRLNSSHVSISYAVFCLKKKKPR